jgi:hypothetical protein
MVTIKREVPVEEAPAQQPNAEIPNAPGAGSALPHPALAKEPRQEDYESVWQAFLLNQEQDYATASEEWRQQYHLHRRLAQQLHTSRDLDMEELQRNSQANPGYQPIQDYQTQLMLLKAHNRRRLQGRIQGKMLEREKRARAEESYAPALSNEGLGNFQSMSDYYQQQSLILEAQNKRRLQERAKEDRGEGSNAPALANEAGKSPVEVLRIPIRPKPAEILSGPTASQLEALVQKAGYDQWRIEPPIPKFEPGFSNMDREAINKYHQEMVAQESTMRQQLLRSPMELTLPEHREARRAYAAEFQRLEKWNYLRLPTYYSVQSYVQRNRDLMAVEANHDFQRWKQQGQSEIHNASKSQSSIPEPWVPGQLQTPRLPQEYQIQLMLLEQKEQERLKLATEERERPHASGPSTVKSPKQNAAFTPPQVKQKRDLEAEFHTLFPPRRMPEYVSGPQNMPKSHLTDYETQLKLLEEQNQKRLSMARKQQQERIDSAIKTEEPLESSQGAPASAPCRRQLRQLEITSRKRLAMARDEQEPVNDGRATESPIPEIDTSWPSEPTAGTHVLLGYQRALAQFNQQGGKRLKLEPIPDYQTHFHNRARALYPDVTPQTEDRTQIQENGWAESPMDRENSVSTFFATPEGTPEAEQMHMSDVNLTVVM